MNFELPQFGLAAAEIFLLTMTCVVLIVDLFVHDDERTVTYWLSLLSIAGAAAITAFSVGTHDAVGFSGMFVNDGMAHALKLFSYVMTAVALVYSRQYLRDRLLARGEYYVLALFALLGIMVMASAHHMLSVYLGLELLSLSLYALVAFDRDSPVASEAAMKYFVLGSIASGTLLYGISIFYGATGTLDLGALTSALAAEGPDARTNVALMLGLAFILVGVTFKLGAVPFHMWVPDVYHGAPTSVTLLIGTVSKIGAFALIARVLAEGMQELQPTWRDMIAVLAALSLVVGIVVAIAQTNLKRMLAYSAISHVGFILLGFLTLGPAGIEASMYYVMAYCIMASGAFGMIILLGRQGYEADEIASFSGLNQRSPWYALIMLMLMFSMTGVPPFIGFIAKLSVIRSALAAGFTGLALLAVLMSVVAAFFYLRVVKTMYFDEPQDHTPITAGRSMRLVLGVNGLAVLVLGIFPSSLIDLCRRALGL